MHVCERLIRVAITCAARVQRREKGVRSASHAITSAVDAEQTTNKRAWNVLHPRLLVEPSRVIAGDNVLSTTIAHVIAIWSESQLRLNFVRTTCYTHGYTRTKFWSDQNFFSAPNAGKFLPRVGTSYLRLSLLLAFGSVIASLVLFLSPRYRRDQLVEGSVTGRRPLY